MLVWQYYRNLENSLKYFLETNVTTDSVTDINSVAIPIYIGRQNKQSWTLPCIAVYIDSDDLSQRLEIGSNKRLERTLIIIDIFATSEGERLDLAKWVADTINDGFTYYAYTVNIATPESPTKVANGLVNVDFLTNRRISLGQTIDEMDAHRHQISISVWKNS